MDLKSFGIFSSIASYFADVYMDDGVIYFILKEKITKKKIGGVILILIGAICVSLWEVNKIKGASCILKRKNLDGLDV